MPYKNRGDLPDSVKDNLPAHAQGIYKEAFKKALQLLNTGEILPIAG